MGGLISRFKGEPKAPPTGSPTPPPQGPPQGHKQETPAAPESKGATESPGAAVIKASPVEAEKSPVKSSEETKEPTEGGATAPPTGAPSDGGVDPAVEGAQSEDRYYNNKSFQKPDVDPSDTQQQGAALKIQTKYRQHHAKQVVQDKREEKAATAIQASYRGYTDRQKVKDLKEGGEEEEAEEEKVEETPAAAKQEEEVDIDLEDPEVQAAATKIQAGFRGHKARQEVKEIKEHAEPAAKAPATEESKAETTDKEEVVDIDLSDPEVAAAATKIQAGVRGYMARKEVHKMKEPKAETAQDDKQEVTPQEVTSQDDKQEVTSEEAPAAAVAEAAPEVKEEAKKKKVPTATLR